MIPGPVKYSKEWISVEDLLPANPNEVIMGGECCEVCYNIDIGYYDSGEWILKGGESPKWKITHWMPLPEPPTDENSAEVIFICRSKTGQVPFAVLTKGAAEEWVAQSPDTSYYEQTVVIKR